MYLWFVRDEAISKSTVAKGIVDIFRRDTSRGSKTEPLPLSLIVT